MTTATLTKAEKTKELQAHIKTLFGDKPTEEHRKFLFKAVEYVPSPEQEAFHFMKDDDGEAIRFKLAAGGEQGGKSYSAAMEMFSYLPWGTLFWIIGPDYSQGHNEFNYIESALIKIGALDGTPTRPEKGQWKLTTVWGTTVITMSAVKPETIAGAAPDGILLVEAAQTEHETFLRCMGRAGPKRGWVCINGTFENEKSGWYRNQWKAWQSVNADGGRSCSLPSWSNRVLYPGGREDTEIKRLEKLHGPDWFAERYAGEPVPPRGLVFREFLHETHVKDVQRSKRSEFEMFPKPGVIVLPENTEDEVWVDPGYTGGYAVCFVTIQNDVAVIYDEIYKQGWTGEEVVLLATKHPRWKYVKKLVMDIAGRQHQAGKSQNEVWYAGTGLRARARKVEIVDGIQRTRISLRPHPETGIPGLILGRECVMTAWELSEGYRYHVNNSGASVDKEGRAIINEKPVDANNHAAKAIAYGLVDNFGPVRRTQRGPGVKPPRRAAGWESL